MHTFNVDKGICISCGKCAGDCLRSVLEMVEGNPVFARPEMCIGCLHCFAICPVGAISLDEYKPTDGTPMAPIPTAQSVENFIRQRRSIRSFRQENIPHDDLRKMLELSWSAPSGANQHLLQISVIDDIKAMNAFRERVYGQLKERLNQGSLSGSVILRLLGEDPDKWLEKDEIFRGAPHMVTVAFARNAATGIQDSIIYLSCLELLARARGYGTLWCGFMNMIFPLLPELKSRLGIAEEYDIGYPMLLGKSRVAYARGVERKGAKIHVVRE